MMPHGLSWAAGCVATVLLSNWLTSTYGLVPAGFGLVVTAGTYSAGLALGLRDAVHDRAGLPLVLLTVCAGSGLSVLVAEERIALASGAAFLLGELLDLAVYTPLRQRGRRRAVALSNAAGAVVDTVGFLVLAGFPLTLSAVGGQVLVKALWVTGGYLAVREVARRALPRQCVVTEGA